MNRVACNLSRLLCQCLNRRGAPRSLTRVWLFRFQLLKKLIVLALELLILLLHGLVLVLGVRNGSLLGYLVCKTGGPTRLFAPSNASCLADRIILGGTHALVYGGHLLLRKGCDLARKVHGR